MKKIAQGIVRLRKLILTVAILLLIPSAIGAVATRINYDILTYLPQDLDSMIGEVALEDDFHLASTGMITVEGLPTNELIAMKKDIDAVAVTYAPGLIGAVLVGVSFAKSAACALGVPLIPVHHVRGHIAANYLAFPELEPPFVALAISGGNTLIVDVRDYTDLKILGATRDDAAGECFAKAARLMGLP